MTEPKLTLPIASDARKQIPLVTGLFDYFPAALAYVAMISKYGNDKHNPGEPLHHARGKSMDHADCAGRHLVDRGLFDPESGLRHTGFLAWRALALLQEELEREEGAPLPRGARLPDEPPELVGPTCMPPAVREWVGEVIGGQQAVSAADERELFTDPDREGRSRR